MAEFFANVGDVDVEQVGKRTVIFIEQMLIQSGAGDELAAMKREIFDEAIRPQLTEKVHSVLYPENIEMFTCMIASRGPAYKPKWKK